MDTKVSTDIANQNNWEDQRNLGGLGVFFLKQNKSLVLAVHLGYLGNDYWPRLFHTDHWNVCNSHLSAVLDTMLQNNISRK